MELNHKQLRYKKWMNLVASDWFSIFLEYLNLFAIIQIDSSFRNHVDRLIWLNLVRNIRPIVVINDLNSQGIIDWLILIDVHPSEITIDVENDKITLDTILRLSRISPKLKSLKCHSNKCISICSTLFQCLGDYNPLLEKLVLCVFCESESTTMDVEEFKKALKHFLVGCPLLRSISLKLSELQTQANDVCVQIYSTLFQCLGACNPLLQELHVSFKSRSSTSLLSESNVELFNESLKHFLVGCPLLRSVTLELSELPSQCITTIANYALNLETLKIRGDLLEQGSIITKETNKLKKLSHLSLSSINLDLDDESLTNLVTGCNQLEYIYIGSRLALTDISLYSIAENCPNLRYICLPIGNTSGEGGITVEGLLALVSKCQKLEIILSAGELPEIVRQELNNRRKL